MTQHRRSRDMRTCARHERKSRKFKHKWSNLSNGTASVRPHLHPIYVARNNEHALLSTLVTELPPVGGMDAFIEYLNGQSAQTSSDHTPAYCWAGLIEFDEPE